MVKIHQLLDRYYTLKQAFCQEYNAIFWLILEKRRPAEALCQDGLLVGSTIIESESPPQTVSEE
ncbi:MAG: hypothetical protein G01um101413_534 [Parcubacteria group bacterium Gr01-1014_13]|nr:MAG: hypothetical protein G01um101413_534 [Parcubacteria group bacterium Gr01-1014_13]